MRELDPEYRSERDAPPTVAATAPEWKGFMKGFSEVMEVQIREKLIAAPARIWGTILAKVGSKSSDGVR